MAQHASKILNLVSSDDEAEVAVQGRSRTYAIRSQRNSRDTAGSQATAPAIQLPPVSLKRLRHAQEPIRLDLSPAQHSDPEPEALLRPAGMWSAGLRHHPNGTEQPGNTQQPGSGLPPGAAPESSRQAELRAAAAERLAAGAAAPQAAAAALTPAGKLHRLRLADRTPGRAAEEVCTPAELQDDTASQQRGSGSGGTRQHKRSGKGRGRQQLGIDSSESDEPPPKRSSASKAPQGKQHLSSSSSEPEGEPPQKHSGSGNLRRRHQQLDSSESEDNETLAQRHKLPVQRRLLAEGPADQGRAAATRSSTRRLRRAGAGAGGPGPAPEQAPRQEQRQRRRAARAAAGPSAPPPPGDLNDTPTPPRRSTRQVVARPSPADRIRAHQVRIAGSGGEDEEGAADDGPGRADGGDESADLEVLSADDSDGEADGAPRRQRRRRVRDSVDIDDEESAGAGPADSDASDSLLDSFIAEDEEEENADRAAEVEEMLAQIRTRNSSPQDRFQLVVELFLHEAARARMTPAHAERCATAQQQLQADIADLGATNMWDFQAHRHEDEVTSQQLREAVSQLPRLTSDWLVPGAQTVPGNPFGVSEEGIPSSCDVCNQSKAWMRRVLLWGAPYNQQRPWRAVRCAEREQALWVGKCCNQALMVCHALTHYEWRLVARLREELEAAPARATPAQRVQHVLRNKALLRLLWRNYSALFQLARDLKVQSYNLQLRAKMKIPGRVVSLHKELCTLEGDADVSESDDDDDDVARRQGHGGPGDDEDDSSDGSGAGGAGGGGTAGGAAPPGSRQRRGPPAPARRAAPPAARGAPSTSQRLVAAAMAAMVAAGNGSQQAGPQTQGGPPPLPNQQQQQQGGDAEAVIVLDGGAAGSDVSCYICGRLGHYSNACPHTASQRTAGTAQQMPQQPPQSQPSQQPSATACFRCGKEGHWAATCTDKGAAGAAGRAGGAGGAGDVGGLGATPPRKGSCYKCGQSGHWAAECTNAGQASPGGASAGNCFKCGKSGHWARDCKAAAAAARPRLVATPEGVPHRDNVCFRCSLPGHWAHECPNR